MRSFSCFGGKQEKSTDRAQIDRLTEELCSIKTGTDRQDEELRASRQRVKELEAMAQLQSAVQSLSAVIHQQQAQHQAATEAQHRQLHAFNLALLEQAEELAALQALLGAPSRKRQSLISRRRVTEDLETSLDHLQAPSTVRAKPDALDVISECDTNNQTADKSALVNRVQASAEMDEGELIAAKSCDRNAGLHETLQHESNPGKCLEPSLRQLLLAPPGVHSIADTVDEVQYQLIAVALTPAL